MKILNKKQWVSDQDEVMLEETNELKIKRFEMKKYYYSIEQFKQLKEAIEDILIEEKQLQETLKSLHETRT